MQSQFINRRSGHSWPCAGFFISRREYLMKLVLRAGCKGADVRKWQLFLIGQKMMLTKADGVFGNELDSCWGGHFINRPDGMHFEVARLNS